MKNGMRAENMSPLDRFLRYVKIDSQSRDGQSSTPSSDGQFTLANMLADELAGLGLREIRVDEHAYVTARLPGRGAPADAPCIGLIAHLDTALETSGADVRPRVIEKYDGGRIELGNAASLDPRPSPSLRTKKAKRWWSPTAARFWARTTRRGSPSS